MKKYSKYKHSGIECLPAEEAGLGQIPEHWEVKRVKDVFLQMSNSGSKLKPDSYIPLENIESFTGKLIKKASNDNNETTNLFTKDDLLLNKLRPYLGKVYLADFDGGVSGEVIVLRPKRQLSIYTKYYLYRFLSIHFIGKINSLTDGVKMPRTNPNKILVLEIGHPPLPEQTAIAHYLDTKTQAIDQRIALLEKKIGYYKELRRSLINETVTKGLDRNVRMKVSELGFKTPEDWVQYRVKDLGFLYSGLSGKSGDDFNQDNNPDNKPFITFNNICNNTYITASQMGTVVVGKGEKQKSAKKGDIFFLMSSEGYEDIGKTSVLADDIDETYLNSFCKGFRVNQSKCNPFFLNYLMLSDYYRKLLVIEGKGFTRINLKMEKVTDFNIIIPSSIAEQQQIADYLDRKLETISNIVSNIQSQIAKLKELRKTLINDVVTGKIMVTE
jgi:type I restriction enzyme S subunit